MVRKAIAVFFIALSCCPGCAGGPGAADLASLLAENVLLVCEGRDAAASEDIFNTVFGEEPEEENWLGELLGLSTEQIEDEWRKTRGLSSLRAAAGETDLVSMQVFDFTHCEAIRQAFVSTFEKEQWTVVDTVEGVPIYRMPEEKVQDEIMPPMWCCLDKGCLVIADRAEEVGETIKRLRGKQKATLADSPIYRKAMAGVPRDADVCFYANLKEYNRLLGGKTPFEHGDIAFMNAFVDFSVMDSGTLAFTKKDDAIVADVGLIFSAPSKAYAAFRTAPGRHTVLEWVPINFCPAAGGTVSSEPDRLERIVVFLDQTFITSEAEGSRKEDIRKSIADFESDIGLKLADVLANIEEAAVAVNPKNVSGVFPSLLFVAKFRNADRLSSMLDAFESAQLKDSPNEKIEEVDLGEATGRKLSDGGYVRQGNYLLFEFPWNKGECLSAALKAQKEKRPILERPEVKSAMKHLHEPSSRVVIMGFDEEDPKDPTRELLLVLTTVEKPLELRIRTDVTRMPREARDFIDLIMEPLITTQME